MGPNISHDLHGHHSNISSEYDKPLLDLYNNTSNSRRFEMPKLTVGNDTKSRSESPIVIFSGPLLSVTAFKDKAPLARWLSKGTKLGLHTRKVPVKVTITERFVFCVLTILTYADILTTTLSNLL
jgi:hypothetical protein